MQRLIVFLFLCVLPVAPVMAQESSSFNIKVFGAEDIVAPTTPLLNATSISPTQVDVSWSTATDNFVVSGYVVYRDGSPIATTTLTLYQDTSLIASTTYSYSVRAFDPSFNYSSSSNIVTVTTPDYPPTPVGEPGQGGTATRVVLNNLTIVTSEQKALFEIETVHPARFEVRWGRTTSYELGYIVNDVFRSSYRTTLTNLEPGTIYHYEVVGYTPLGRATVLEKGEFRTKSVIDTLPPANVIGFFGRVDGDNVQLSWMPPVDTSLEVRVVRSHLGFPTHLYDGVVVYQGKEGDVVDRDVLKQYSPVYYTAFVVDAFGNVSSGAVLRIYATSGSGEQPALPSGGDSLSGFEGEGTASTSPTLSPDTRMPLLEEIFITQDTARYSLQTSEIVLDSKAVFLLSIPATAISKNLKSIIASLSNPSESREVYSFMLRINKDGTAYEAVVPAIGIAGYSRLTIDVYDYEAKVVGTYKKTLQFSDNGTQSEVPVFPDQIILAGQSYGKPLLVVAVLSGLVWFLLWRRRHREDNV